MKKCPRCKGTGRTEIQKFSLGMGPIRPPETEPCNYRKCGGKGFYAFDPREEAKLDKEEADRERRRIQRNAEVVASTKNHVPIPPRPTPTPGAGRDELQRRIAAGPKKKQAKTSRLSIAEQLAVLAKLRSEGSLTEKEFQTLKTQLISGGDS